MRCADEGLTEFYPVGSYVKIWHPAMDRHSSGFERLPLAESPGPRSPWRGNTVAVRPFLEAMYDLGYGVSRDYSEVTFRSLRTANRG